MQNLCINYTGLNIQLPIHTYTVIWKYIYVNSSAYTYTIRVNLVRIIVGN